MDGWVSKNRTVRHHLRVGLHPIVYTYIHRRKKYLPRVSTYPRYRPNSLLFFTIFFLLFLSLFHLLRRRLRGRGRARDDMLASMCGPQISGRLAHKQDASIHPSIRTENSSPQRELEPLDGRLRDETMDAALLRTTCVLRTLVR